jgi:hypothetical protein
MSVICLIYRCNDLAETEVAYTCPSLHTNIRAWMVGWFSLSLGEAKAFSSWPRLKPHPKPEIEDRFGEIVISCPFGKT